MEEGCINDIKANNLECSKLLIKNNTTDLLSTRNDSKLGVGTDIIPDADITFSLGTADRRFKELHLSPGTLHLGDQTMKSSSEGIELDKIVLEELSLTKNNFKQKFVPHNSLGVNHTFTMPQSLPSATRFLKCDTSGNFTFDNIDYNNGPGTLTSIFTSDTLVKEFAIGLNFNEDFVSKISTGFNDRVNVSLNKNLMLGETEANTLFVNSTTFFDAPVNFNQNNPVITLSGDVSGTATMNNLKDVTINTTIQNNSVALGTDTTGNYIATISGTANEISVSNSGSENANVTLSLPTTTSISSGKTLDVSSGTFTTSTAQQQTIVSSTNVINAGGVMITGNQTIEGSKTFSNTIIGDINGNAESVTNGVYTTSSVTSLSDITSAGSGSIITDNERTKLNGIEASATADQTDEEIKVAYEHNSNTNCLTDALLTKLNGIEASADVTDTANVTSAGAVMTTTIDAKGDILVGTANDTITRLPVGTNNYVLSADSSTATGLKWKAESGGGGGGGSSTFEGLSDTESFSGNAGKILKLNTAENLLEFVDESSGGGGSTTFLNLTDVTPSSYSGQSGKSVIVNSSGNGLEFGLGNVDNTSDANKPVSTAQQTALDLKAPINNPTFTGTVSGVTKSMIGLDNVDNTSDANKPVSTAQQTALNLKAPINNPIFTGDVSIGDDNKDSFVVNSNSLFTGTFKATGDGDIKEINDYMDLDFGLLTTSRPPQNKTGIYIPYYQYPDWTPNSTFLENGFKNLMNILDRNTDVPVLAIVNPSSGPGESSDPNYKRFIKRLNNHNITIIGYLATSEANKTVANVRTELLKWFNLYPEIKGIFFDEVPEFTDSNKAQHIAYYNQLYRMVKSESRRVLKRFLTVTINTGVTNEILYPLSIYEHSGDITNVCFDQILDHENSIYPNIYSIENDNDLASIRHFNRGARIAIVHSQNTYNETMVKKMMKYWSWLFITKDVMNNPFDDISLAYIEEMCKTFSDNSKFDDKLDKVGNISIGEDNSDLLTINSTINIPGGTTGQSLVKGADGNITYSTVSSGGGSDITIQNNGTGLTTAATTLNFTTGITASGSGSTITIAKDSTILDGATITTNELNVLDGNTSATSTTIADADRVVLNDDGTMKQVAVTDLAAYLDDEITAMPNLTSVGTLSSLTVSGNLVADGSTFKIDSVNNRVGIGTATPIRPLHIKSEGSVFAIEGNTHSYIEFYPDSYSSGRKGYFGYPGSTNDGLYFINENNANIVFGTNSAERLIINGSGDVGIGTASPSTKLHVSGNITCTTLVGNCSGTSTSINITEDTSSNSKLLIPFTNSTSSTTGSRQLKSNSNLNINPSTLTLETPKNITIKGSLASSQNDERPTTLKFDLPFTSGVKNASSATLVLKDILTASSSARPSLGVEFYESYPSYTETHFTIVSHSSTDGRVGIGTTSPQSQLHIEQANLPADGSFPYTNVSQGGQGIRISNSSNYWGIYISNNKHLRFNYSGDLKGYVDQNDNNAQMNFTGQHRSILNKNIDENSVGLIVSSNGKYININNSLNTNINESLPICSITSIDNDTKVFGVISDKEDTNSNRDYSSGNFVSSYEKTNKNEQRMYINSLGEGAIWVCNKNDVLVNGDYISSSSVVGYGQKQILEEGTLKNFTVAKITCDCDFSLTKIVKQKLKVITTTETYEVNVTQDIEKTNTETKIKYDETLQKYVEETITTTTTEKENLYDIVNVYDSSGDVLLDSEGNARTYQIERKETKTKIITNIDYDSNGNVQYEDDLDSDGNQQMIYPFETRFLQADGTQITETEYNTKLAAEEEVYISCFVGCTYHCG